MQLYKTKILIKALLFSFVLFFPFSSSVHAEEPQGAIHLEKRKLFSRIADAVSSVKTVSGGFVQERRTDILEKPLISKGRFYFEPPRRLLWETTEPSTSGFALEGREARRWKDDRRFAQVFDINQDPAIKSFAEQVFTWMRADFKKLEKMFDICILAETPPTFKLIPRGQEDDGPIDHLMVRFSDDMNHVAALELHEKNGDSFKISFVEVVINGPPLEKLF